MTDTEISNAVPGAQRELQRWVPDEVEHSPPSSNAFPPLGARPPNGDQTATRNRDNDTFGKLANPQWNQFEANERLFGSKSSFDEENYTTRIDRTEPGFKERERRAEQLAREILSVRVGF
jgi:PAB1-binding protein PBP1